MTDTLEPHTDARYSMARRRLLASVMGFATLTLVGAGCGGVTEPRDATPASITAGAGELQSGVAGEELPEPIVVEVTNARGEPVAGVLVTFRVTAGNGTLRVGAAQTDAQGLARDYWKLGTTAGSRQTVEARVIDASGGATGLVTVFNVTARTGAPALFSATSTIERFGTVGVPLSTPINVLVKDRFHNPVAGVNIRFTPGAGSGTVTPSLGVTGASGSVSATWTLGSAAGPQTLTVSVEGAVTSPASFTAKVTATDFSGVILWDNLFRRLPQQTGTRQADLVVGDTLHFNAIVRSASGQTVAGAPVTWESVDATGSVARVSPGGLTEALAPGMVRITARSGSMTSDTIALRVLPPLRPASVAAMGTTVCVTFAAGGFTCVEPPSAHITGPLPGTEAFRSIGWGYHGTLSSTCGLDATGNVLCRGADGSIGALGGGITFSTLSSSNGSYYCGLSADGRAYCWGNNLNGRLGTGSAASSATPVPVAGVRRYSSISAGDLHTCAAATDGTAWCWGTNGGFALGQASLPNGYACSWSLGATDCSLVPVQVAGTTRFRTVSVGGYGGSCGLTVDSTIECWGTGRQGATGNGIVNDRFTPAPISSPARYVALSTGTFYSCAIRTDGLVDCWGGNFNGRTGRGATDGVSLPLPILYDRRFTSISAGGPATCGITEGELWCWGIRPPSPRSPLDRVGPLRIGFAAP